MPIYSFYCPECETVDSGQFMSFSKYDEWKSGAFAINCQDCGCAMKRQITAPNIVQSPNSESFQNMALKEAQHLREKKRKEESTPAQRAAFKRMGML